FHADCYLVPREATAADEGVRCTRTTERGYDKLTFSYGPSMSFADALEALCAGAEDELGFFYLIQAIDLRRVAAWGEVDALIGRLVALHERTGVRAAAQRLIRTGRL